jgi:hypothetical protein
MKEIRDVLKEDMKRGEKKYGPSPFKGLGPFT